MTLTTHAIVGATAASLFPNTPVLAFAAGFASHFAIDALPHWDYKILSKEHKPDDKMNEDMKVSRPEFLLDFVRIGSDAILGGLLAIAIFSFWLFHLPVWFVAFGALAGMLPDPLQFVYYKTRSKLLVPLQRFHIWVQKGKSIHPSPLVGIFYQFALVVVLIWLRKLF